MVLSCPKCESLLLIKHGIASSLDGERNHLCLSCGSDLQPRRLRGLLSLTLMLGLILPIPLIILGIYLLAEFGTFRQMLLPFIGAAACVIAVVLARRAMRAPVPVKKVVSSFPSDRVRLTELKVRPEGVIPPAPDWVTPFGDYTYGLIEASAKSLGSSAGRFKVIVKTECNEKGRTHTLGFRGTPDRQCLEQFFEEIERLPSFAIPSGVIRLELWFKVG